VPERIRRDGDRLVLTLHPAEVETLRDLGRQLETLLDEPGAGPEGVPDPDRGQDPVRDRLFPRAYLDPTADQEERDWQAAVHGDLVKQKSEAVEALMASLDVDLPKKDRFVEIVLEPETAEQWAAALNDVRLALGVVLEVTEEEMQLPPGDPRAPGLELYQWLTMMQGVLIDALLGGSDEIWRAAQDYR
jgi:hypothetical protein